MIDLQEYTAENLLSAMLSRVSDDLDKREGSIIFDALAPAAYALADLYKNLSDAYADSFIGTALGNALDMRGAEMGIYRRAAVKAVRKGIFYGENNVPFHAEVGLRFSTVDGEKSQCFTVLEQIDEGVFALEAEVGGAAANDYVGTLLPVQVVSGLVSCTMEGEPIIDGADTESDEDFRSRYLYKINNEPMHGNASAYLQWALEYPGIGKAKVFPLWQGENTVKVSILGSDDLPCSQALVAEFQEYLDPNGKGLGNGIAPIGAKVTVATVSLKEIDVAFTFTLGSGKNAPQVKALIENAVKSYFSAISYCKTKVYYMEVGAAILSVDGVESLTNLTLNGVSGDISLGEEERPYLRTFTGEVGA